MNSFKIALEKQLGISIKNLDLYEVAFTHPSYANDHRFQHVSHYERLEFLGDAVVELAVSNFLFHHFSEYPEGQLTKMRAATVRAETLAAAMKQTELMSFVRLGKGEEQSAARERTSLCCDVFEALVGAIYLDNDFEAVKKVLTKYLFPLIQADDFSHVMDYKSYLQEELQKNGEVQISYTIIAERGPDHQKEFTVEVAADGHILGQGEGTSRKRAEQAAAKEALASL